MPLVDAHTLENDFPEHVETIKRLYEEDLEFKAESERYNQLDKKIRGLEGAGVTTDDQHYNALKFERAHMKDQLYRRIANSSKGIHES